MRTFRHINTGIERELKDGSKLISVLEGSPSWQELIDAVEQPQEPEEKEESEPQAKAKK